MPVTETLPMQFQHPIKAFRYTTLSHLPGQFCPSLYVLQQIDTAGSLPPDLAISQQMSSCLEELASLKSSF